MDGPLGSKERETGSVCVVDTDAVIGAIKIVKHLIDSQNDIIRQDQVLTSFDCEDVGSTVMLREAAVRNNYAHLLVNLPKCTGLMRQKEKCFEHILSLEKQSGESFTMKAGAIVRMLERILREGAVTMLSDCLATLSSGGFDTRGTHFVHAHRSKLPQGQQVHTVYGEIDEYIYQAQKLPGSCTGVLIQVKNAHDIFFDECMPDALCSPDYTEYPPSRMGAFMLRALADALGCCCAHDRKIIWAFTGVRMGAEHSFYLGSFFPNELSTNLSHFDTEDVKKALSGGVSLSVLDDKRLDLYWKRLVGPPGICAFFLRSLCNIADCKSSEISSSEAVVKAWELSEASVVSMLSTKDRMSRMDFEVAKFCCIASIFSYVGDGSLNARILSIHSSVFALAESGFLRIRLDKRDASRDRKIYFDRPYPLLLSLFVEKYGLPRYALGPLLRAVGSIKHRNSQLHVLTLAEVAFAFDLHKMFEGESRACLLSSLGLRDLPPVESLRVVESVDDFNFSDANSHFSGGMIHVVCPRSVEAESVKGFRVALGAVNKDGAELRLLLFISLEEHDGPSVRRELDQMARMASLPLRPKLSGSATAKEITRTYCVFACPYGEANLGEDFISSPLECTPGGEHESARLFYFGRDHQFWNSSLLNLIVRDRKYSALNAYLLGLLNLRHVSKQWGRAGDTDMLVMEHVSALTTNIRSAKAGFSISEMVPDRTDLATCMRVHFDGKPPVVLVSCVCAYAVSGLSLLNARLLNDSLRLGLSAADVEEVQTFATQYRKIYQDQNLPDPSKVSLTVKSILDCLLVWGTGEGLPQLGEFIKGRLKADLYCLTMEDLSECKAPLGAKLALLNVLSCKKGASKKNFSPNAPRGPAKRSIVPKTTPTKRQKIQRKSSRTDTTSQI